MIRSRAQGSKVLQQRRDDREEAKKRGATMNVGSAKQKRRGAPPRNDVTKSPSWRRRSNGRRSGGPDLPSALETHRSTRVTFEGPGVGDVLHSVRTKKQRHRDINAKCRPSLQRHGNTERGSPHIWSSAATLKGMDGEDPGKQGRRSDSSRSGEGGSGADAQEDGRRPEAARLDCMSESVQASPNPRKAWRSPKVANYLGPRSKIKKKRDTSLPTLTFSPYFSTFLEDYQKRFSTR